MTTDVEARLGRCGHELTGQQRVWCSDTCQKLAARTARLRAHFDLSDDEYAAILAEQGGGCAICHRPPKATKSLAVDHDHRTTFIRGLACYACNRRVLGARTDEMILAVAEYIKNPPARRVIGDRPAPGRPPAKRKKRGPYRKRVSR